jgi:hypothetical protein
MRQLPVGATISHMISSTLNNLYFAFNAQWPWIVLLAIAYGVLGQVIGWDVLLSQDEAALERHFQNNPEHLLLFLLSSVAYLIAFASIAVSWHRYILKDEVPATLSEKLRIDSLVWRYLGNLILLVLMLIAAALPIALLMGIFGAAGAPLPVIVVLVAAMVVVMFYLVTRWGLKFPAIALDRKDFGFREAWRVTQENAMSFLGLVVAFLVVNFALALIIGLVSYVLVSIGGETVGSVLSLAVQSLLQWVTTIMGITLYTSLYGFFVEGRDF